MYDHTREEIMIVWYDDKNNINVVYIALPEGMNEGITVNPDGSYTAFISTQISQKKQWEAYQHALWHIQHDDFSRTDDVQKIEAEAHRHTDH